MLNLMRICDLNLKIITRNKLQVFYNILTMLILLATVNGAEEKTIPMKWADEERLSFFFCHSSKLKTFFIIREVYCIF